MAWVVACVVKLEALAGPRDPPLGPSGHGPRPGRPVARWTCGCTGKEWQVVAAATSSPGLASAGFLFNGTPRPWKDGCGNATASQGHSSRPPPPSAAECFPGFGPASSGVLRAASLAVRTNAPVHRQRVELIQPELVQDRRGGGGGLGATAHVQDTCASLQRSAAVSCRRPCLASDRHVLLGQRIDRWTMGGWVSLSSMSRTSVGQWSCQRPRGLAFQSPDVNVT